MQRTSRLRGSFGTNGRRRTRPAARPSFSNRAGILSHVLRCLRAPRFASGGGSQQEAIHVAPFEKHNYGFSPVLEAVPVGPEHVIQSAGATTRKSSSPFIDRVTTANLEGSFREYPTIPNLSEGDIVFGRYIVEQGTVQGKPRIHMAKNVTSKDNVVLKFYESRFLFENCRKMHWGLPRSKFVCKLVDFIDKDGILCLVFERGKYTLEKFIDEMDPTPKDKETILEHILQGLTCLHKNGAVHCDLKPSNVMFFGRDHKWKILDLDSCTKIGERFQGQTTRLYAAPEMVYALLNGSEIIAEPSMDMWSFGAIAFELLTGEGKKLFAERRSDLKTVATLLGSPLYVEDSIKLVKKGEERNLLRQLLLLNKDKRNTAIGIATSAFFSRRETSSHPRSRLRNGKITGRITTACHDSAKAEVQEAPLAISVDLDHLRQCCHSSSQACAICDSNSAAAVEGVPNGYPVFALKLGKSYQVGIRFASDSNSEIRVKRVLEMKVQLQNDDSFNLDMRKVHVTDAICETEATLDSNIAAIRRCYRTSFLKLTSREKMLNLELVIWCENTGGNTHQFPVRHRICFRILPSTFRLLTINLLEKLRKI